MEYWSYKNLFIKTKNKGDKCSQCDKKLSSQQIYLCSSCKKSLCYNCKLEDIIPEVSLRNKNTVCADCLSMISSTNKMLYDF